MSVNHKYKKPLKSRQNLRIVRDTKISMGVIFLFLSIFLDQKRFTIFLYFDDTKTPEFCALTSYSFLAVSSFDFKN